MKSSLFVDVSSHDKLIANWSTFRSYFGNEVSVTNGKTYLLSYTRMSEASAWPDEGCTVIKGNNLSGANQNLFFGIVKATSSKIYLPGDTGNDIAIIQLD